MKIAFLDVKTIGRVNNLDKLKEFGELAVYPVTPDNMRIKRLKGVSVVITNKVIIDKQVIDKCPDLRLICVAATGTNNIDIRYAFQKGIDVKNVTGYSTGSVAQSVFAMLLFLMNKLKYYDSYVKSGAYCRSDIFTHHGQPFMELMNKRFGIIGLGTIGNRVAEIAEVFGCEVVYHSTSGKNTQNAKYRHLDLEELLKTSDIVSIHCPLNESTRNLVDLAKISLMKPSAYLINAGRGGIVIEKDLARALDEEIIAGAGLDVLTDEPIKSDNPLLRVYRSENLIITPHIAWASIESRDRLLDQIYANIKEFAEHNNNIPK
ncbi:MAG: D-2-hydroxyacid dehydrogenase [Bacteroidales bacterium]|nr:D-2-hydroxyacid dehydrogenase [Bacteroidales bacterium]